MQQCACSIMIANNRARFLEPQQQQQQQQGWQTMAAASNLLQVSYDSVYLQM
jgi:hypothetical protein